MFNISYGDNTFEFGQLPETTQRALAQRGLTHFLGSEQASKTSPQGSWFGKFEKEQKRKPTEAELEAQKAANVKAAVAIMLEGKMGVPRGPKVDPVEAEMERIAIREVWDTLANANLTKKNKRPDDDDEFEFSDGTKFTFGVMVDRKLAKHEARLRGLAQKKVDAERKAREATAAKAKKVAEAGPVTADALDL